MGSKAWSSTINPRSVATISSRASINTLPNEPSPKKTGLSGNLWTSRSESVWRAPCTRLIFPATSGYLLTMLRQTGSITIDPTAREHTVGKHDEGAAVGADRPAAEARHSDRGARVSSPEDRP